MRYETIEVNPETASLWLQKNADFQRKLRQSVVDRYARDMLNGTWALTHQGLAFDSKGRLIDGQHRLAAIAVAYYSEMDRVRLAEFIRLLCGGIASDAERDSTTIRLREWLRDASGNASATARVECFMKTQRVLKAYMNGERLTKLYTPNEACYSLKRRATVAV